MRKIFTGCLSVFVVLAIAKVLIAQPVMKMEMTANAQMVANEVVANTMIGNVAQANMEMHEEMGGY